MRVVRSVLLGMDVAFRVWFRQIPHFQRQVLLFEIRWLSAPPAPKGRFHYGASRAWNRRRLLTRARFVRDNQRTRKDNRDDKTRRCQGQAPGVGTPGMEGSRSSL